MISGWIGALLIFGANSMLALRRAALNSHRDR
jgi:hypothetical protein